MDVTDQDFTEMHAFCVEEDGVMWFDHGVECKRPLLHKEPAVVAEMLGKLLESLEISRNRRNIT